MKPCYVVTMEERQEVLRPFVGSRFSISCLEKLAGLQPGSCLWITNSKLPKVNLKPREFEIWERFKETAHEVHTSGRQPEPRKSSKKSLLNTELLRGPADGDGSGNLVVESIRCGPEPLKGRLVGSWARSGDGFSLTFVLKEPSKKKIRCWDDSDDIKDTETPIGLEVSEEKSTDLSVRKPEIYEDMPPVT